ncbi:MAG TPA: hypothetical protein DGG95_01295 [Cytophagales bacterium]|jgi:hypothetical protein|nr:hypothetical protein [Cytophagales bacterium]
MLLHKETVTPTLLNLVKQIFTLKGMESFRLVGGTGLSLQLGHRKSVDIDLFSNEKVDKTYLRKNLARLFPEVEVVVTEDSLTAEIDQVRVDIYDDWMIPFRQAPVIAEGIAMASLRDIAALKLSSITGRREKKDYIDLYFLFEQLGAQNVLTEFKEYDPHLSTKSILFALTEVDTARNNKSPMPDLILPVDWSLISNSMKQAAKEYVASL